MICCLVANSAWNISNFRISLIRMLLEQGHDVHVVAPPGRELGMLAGLGCHVHEVNIDCRGTHPIRDGRLLLTLWQTYRRIRPDVLLHYTIKPVIYGSLAARLLGLPALNTITGLGTAFLRDGWLNLMVKCLYKLALAPARVVIFQNADDRALFVQAGLLHPEHAMLVPGSGVNITHFSPPPLRLRCRDKATSSRSSATRAASRSSLSWPARSSSRSNMIPRRRSIAARPTARGMRSWPLIGSG